MPRTLGVDPAMDPAFVLCSGVIVEYKNLKEGRAPLIYRDLRSKIDRERRQDLATGPLESSGRQGTINAMVQSTTADFGGLRQKRYGLHRIFMFIHNLLHARK